MNISDAVVITSSFGAHLISNQYLLSISNLSVLNVIDNDIYDPNGLHAYVLIVQSSIESNLFLYDVYLVGSTEAIVISACSASIINCTFQQSRRALLVKGANSFIMRKSKIRNNGQYYAGFVTDYHRIVYETAGFQITESKNIIISESIFSGFDPKGLIHIKESSSISFTDNMINVDISNLYYDVPKDGIYFDDSAPLTYLHPMYSSTISNEFKYDPDQISLPVGNIAYLFGSGLNCVSGNKLILRWLLKNILDYISNTSFNCKNGMYGNMDTNLFDVEMIIFVNDTANETILFVAYQSDIALDNVNITVSDWIPRNLISSAINGNILLVDSYIMNGYDISYNNDSCDLIQNHRLKSNAQHIASMLISCVISTQGYLQSTLNSSVTSYIEHLSQYRLNLIPESLSYYPGGKLLFKHQILDKLGNIIPTNYTSSLSIGIQTSSFYTEVQITQNNECPICDDGILINTLSIDHNSGSISTLNISMINTPLILSNSALSLNVTGCPRMYGPSPSNYTCIPCNTDYFSIKQFNVEQCSTCDPDNNPYITCADERIFIQANHWMGITDSGDLISSICPAKQCCQFDEGCDFIEHEM